MHLSSIWSPAKFSENRTPTFGHFGVVSHEDHCWGGPEWPPVHPEKALTSTDSDSDAGFILIYGILLGFLPKFRGTQKKKAWGFPKKWININHWTWSKKIGAIGPLSFEEVPHGQGLRAWVSNGSWRPPTNSWQLGSKKGCLMRTCNGHLMGISWWFHGDFMVI